MASCCRAAPCEEIFNSRTAEWALRTYLRRGLGKVEREMLTSVPARHLEGGRVLEIGGGIGALQAELLRRGAERGEVIELVDAYAPYAGQLARELGVADRTSFRVLDLLENAGAAQPADVRSEEHTSELQSRPHLVCRLLLEKKKKKKQHN